MLPNRTRTGCWNKFPNEGNYIRHKEAIHEVFEMDVDMLFSVTLNLKLIFIIEVDLVIR